MSRSFVCAAAVTISAAVTSAASAQEIPREEYLRFLPLRYPRLVQQNDATRELHLYGDPQDPAYRDVDPVDGIDDARHDVLRALAARFAPYLVQNSGDIPVNFDMYVENRESFPLHVDTWNVTGEEPRLESTQEIDLARLGKVGCGEGDGPAQAEDCEMVALLRELSPSAPEAPSLVRPLVRQRPDRFKVLFFDFPGEGPGSWKEAYQGEYERTPEEARGRFPHAYVHPFLERVEGPDGVGYELVLQYWFFYPTNDGGNNHEGDWEHLNVLVAPRSRVDRPLPAETVARILRGEIPATDDAADPLVIRRADYYFHHFSMTLDFSDPNVYLPRDEWRAEVRRREESRFQEKEIWRDIRHMAYVDEDETVVNTHPFAYIGADNKGLDQGLSMPGGKNRSSHGTFPFPGQYHDIGPAGATEQISLDVDPRRYLRKVREGRTPADPELRRGRVLSLAEPDRLRIVPDWERVADLVRESPEARRSWSWLLLPIRWGYPATASPFAGIVPHADTGNAAPVGPSFSLGWNQTGASSGFHSYEPHRLPSVFPLALQDSFRNDLGFFNFTVPLLLNLPPLDFVTRMATYPFRRVLSRRDPVYYPRDGVPFRFVGFSSGVSVQVFDEDFDALALNGEHFEQFVGRLVGHLVESGADSTTVPTADRDLRRGSVMPFYQVAFYIGRRFTSENTFRNARARIGVRFEFNNIPDYRYSADVDLWEYAGSIRYGLTRWALQPFLKAGYGWSWYRLENVEANGVPFDPATTAWIKPKGIWPNTWHVGLGFEYVPWRHTGKLPRGAELALRVEYGRYFQELGLDLSNIPLESLGVVFPTLGDVPIAERVVRDDVVIGVTLSF